jgi:ACS family glucarate transporter-like MFS transporter
MSLTNQHQPSVVGAALGSVGRRRYYIALALGLVACLGYMDRVNFSVAAPHIIQQFHLSNGEYGIATSIFNWAYVVFLIPVGIFADKTSTRFGLLLAIVVWSVGAGMTGLSIGLGTLVAARLIMGAGEAPVFPVGNIVVRQWAPSKDRGLFTGVLNAGTVVGPAVGAIVAAYLIVSLGWRGSFIVEGIVGLAVALIWYLVYKSPEKTRWLSEQERAYILANRENALSTAVQGARMSIGSLLRTRSIWGLMIAQGCSVYTSYVFLSFLPLYLIQARHLQVLSSGWVTGVTYGVAAVGSVILARVSDRLLKKADILRGGRRKTVAAVMILSLPILAIPAITNVGLIIALVSYVLIMDTAAITLNWTLASDLIVDKPSSGRVFALTGVGGNLFGLAAPIVTGFLVDATGSYVVPFIVCAALLVVGAIATMTLSRRPIQPTAIAEKVAA